MAMAMAALVARLRSQSGGKVLQHPLLLDLACRSLIPSWSLRESYATKGGTKSRGAWEKCGRRGEMDDEDYGYAWDDHEIGYGRDAEIPHLDKRKRKEEEEKKKRTGKKSFKLRTEKCMRPFCLDVFLSGKYIHASVMHRVTSKVVAVVSTNAKEYRNVLKSYKDFTACKVVGETLAVRAKEADVFSVVYEPRKGEKFEGRLAAVVHTFEYHGVNVDME